MSSYCFPCVIRVRDVLATSKWLASKENSDVFILPSYEEKTYLPCKVRAEECNKLLIKVYFSVIFCPIQGLLKLCSADASFLRMMTGFPELVSNDLHLHVLLLSDENLLHMRWIPFFPLTALCFFSPLNFFPGKPDNFFFVEIHKINT